MIIITRREMFKIKKLFKHKIIYLIISSQNNNKIISPKSTNSAGFQSFSQLFLIMLVYFSCLWLQILNSERMPTSYLKNSFPFLFTAYLCMQPYFVYKFLPQILTNILPLLLLLLLFSSFVQLAFLKYIMFNPNEPICNFSSLHYFSHYFTTFSYSFYRMFLFSIYLNSLI